MSVCSRRDAVLRGIGAAACLAAGTEGQGTAGDGAPALLEGGEEMAPLPMREFRAAWVATVDNIDWPSKRGLPVANQKAELLGILDTAQRMNLNAIILQVRPACDALYNSPHEPWSEYLTGAMGTAPDPYYDPLEYAVSEAHRRGLELHAWFNPYRAHHASATSPISATHISRRSPSVCKTYGKQMWLDPGEPTVQQHSTRVILDVVKRYNIDGVHLDDYFYPYKVKDSSGNEVDFPDGPSFRRYTSGGGSLPRNDWRRENVNQFIERLYEAIKKEKRWVKFGISPFGIARPGLPPQIKGFDQYAELYADTVKWLKNGWCDYWTPQLYWRIDPPAQSYPVLLRYWSEQNVTERHLWPGNYTSKAGTWPAEEFANQVRVTRKQAGAGGNVHFSMKALVNNQSGVATALREVYSEPALVPASPWLGGKKPPVPKAALRKPEAGTGMEVVFPTGPVPWLWIVQFARGSTWTTRVAPGVSKTIAVPDVGRVLVRAMDRLGSLSEAQTLLPQAATSK